MAVDLFKKRYQREPKIERDEDEKIEFLLLGRMRDTSLLIGCTNLVDKATIIWKLRLVGNATRSEVLGFFNDLRDIRDRCAHPGGDDELISKDRLAQFVASAKRIRSDLAASEKAQTI